MGSSPVSTQRPYQIAIALVTLLALYHGAVPLLTRSLFGVDQRFAPALVLPAPWWWLACLAITLAGAAGVVALDAARTRHVLADDAGASAASEPADAPDVDEQHRRSSGYDALSGAIFLLALYGGVAPLVARIIFDTNLFLALPLRLPSPWWWITSLAVIVVSTLLLALVEQARQRGTR